MSSLPNNDSDLRDMAAALRQRATHVRRVMEQLTWGPDREALRKYAEEMEAQADETERHEG